MTTPNEEQEPIIVGETEIDDEYGHKVSCVGAEGIGFSSNNDKPAGRDTALFYSILKNGPDNPFEVTFDIDGQHNRYIKDDNFRAHSNFIVRERNQDYGTKFAPFKPQSSFAITPLNPDENQDGDIKKIQFLQVDVYEVTSLPVDVHSTDFGLENLKLLYKQPRRWDV